MGNNFVCIIYYWNQRNKHHIILSFLVLSLIEKEGPFTALNFFTVDRSTFISIVSNDFAYLGFMPQ